MEIYNANIYISQYKTVNYNLCDVNLLIKYINFKETHIYICIQFVSVHLSTHKRQVNSLNFH